MKTTTQDDLQPRAQAALSRSPFFELRGLRVDARNGEVTISGCVSSYYHKQVAQEVVRSVCKNTEVINAIEVRGEEEYRPERPLPLTQ